MPFLGKTGLFIASRGKKPASATIPTSGLLINLDASNPSSYGGSGTTWTTLTGNGYNGTLTNGPTYTATAPSYFNMDGANDYINIADATALRPGVGGTNAVTAIIWVYITSYTAWDGVISKQFSGGGGYDGFSLNIITNNAVSLKMNGGGVDGTYNSASTNVFSLNTWTMFTVVPRFGGGATYPSKVYVNTTEVVSAANSESSMPNHAPIQIPAGIQDGTTYPACRIGSFYYYNRALSAAEITTIYNTTKTRFGL